MKANFELPPPGNWIAFEDVCLKTWGVIWEIPHKIDFNSTNSQGQNGVDIVGVPAGKTRPEGIQCKNKRLHFKSGQANRLTAAIIDEEVEKALTFEPPLAHLTIATSLYKDKEIEIYVRKLSEIYQQKGLFTIQICFWEYISDKIQQNKSLLGWYLNQEDLIGGYSVEVLLDNNSESKLFKPEFQMERQIYRRQTNEEFEEEVKGFSESFGKAYKEINKSLPFLSRLKNNLQNIIPRYKKGDLKVTLLINGEPPKLYPRKKLEDYERLDNTYEYKPECEFSFLIKNTGSKVIDDFKVEFEVIGNYEEFNVEAPTVSQALNRTYQQHSRKFENDKGRIKPPHNTIVQQDTFKSGNFYIRPQMIGESSVLIKWTLFSRDFNTSGELHLIVKPKYRKKETVWFIGPDDQPMDKHVFSYLRKKGIITINY